ncbi:amino acid ABC transporter substrate-binding protein (PAAT family) [Isoptericola sp. CG 20/1183]|uniref:Amino acid ABC transporter substrate-binding protein (PAAT family) n=1 Tax=Isoptericola halotolerans TaxID=300560 RepID=A0ABX5EHS5_9MICO|nr:MULTISPECIES: amino acid ABC transporter substrate-binding protein [Isoptericola]PRZ04145.1 amino acid ABC transporter substrate-binding protein (PAAT family) [Isoptericola sp. CG 20/1183]PRZ10030.1 amino acid ABC transporter substrate-binding protein (PAAT family) [Isoptericola halotolerans]
MRRHRAILATATATVTALALAACGGSGDGSDGADAGSDLNLTDDGTLTVATEGTYRPFTFHDDSGELVGYDVEVAEAVAEKLGLEIEFAETQWDAIFAALDAGRVDTIANQVSMTPERVEKYEFSQPYTISRGVVVVPEGDTSISSFEDLDGKTTAQSLTSNWRTLAEESGAQIEAVEGWAQSVALIEQGRVDATINDSLTVLDYLNEHPDAPIEIAAETEETSESGFVVTPERAALAEAIDGALDELRSDGTLAELSDKYFGEDVSE